MDKECLLKTYLALAKEHGQCANQHWHTELLIWLTKIWKPKIILELGTYCGGAFYCFLTGIIENNEGHIYTVDIVNRKDKLIPATPSSNFFTHIVNNALKISMDKPIDFLFIDDDHTYEHVMAEWEKFEKQVNVGGLIFFHDVQMIEPDGKPCGVPRAVKTLWKEHKDRFVRLYDLGAKINGDLCGLEIWLKLRSCNNGE